MPPPPAAAAAAAAGDCLASPELHCTVRSTWQPAGLCPIRYPHKAGTGAAAAASL
jgi:hypothetical protein